MTEDAARAGSPPLISVARHPRIIAVMYRGQTLLHTEEKEFQFTSERNKTKESIRRDSLHH